MWPWPPMTLIFNRVLEVVHIAALPRDVRLSGSASAHTLRRNWKLLCSVLHIRNVTWQQRLCICWTLWRYKHCIIIIISVQNFIKLSAVVHELSFVHKDWRRCWKQYCRRFGEKLAVGTLTLTMLVTLSLVCISCDGKGVGQNAFFSSMGFVASHAIASWGGERDNWNFDSMTCTPDTVCGHWTQV